MRNSTSRDASSEPISPSTWAQFQPVEPLATSEAQGWENLALYHFRNPKKWQMEQPPVAWHLIAVHLANPSQLSMQLNGERIRGRTTPGSLNIMAAQHESLWEWDQEIDELHLCLNTKVLNAAAEQVHGRPVELISGVNLQDPWIFQVALRLMVEAQSSVATTRLFGDLMAQAIALQLLRGHTNATVGNDLDKVSISRVRLRRATNFIRENLAADISIVDIAGAAAMSTFHFAHCFKQQMGVSPYQYLMQQRIERAAQLLRTTNEPVSQIALSAGFSNQSHFTTVFKKMHGITPMGYRRQVGTG